MSFRRALSRIFSLLALAGLAASAAQANLTGLQRLAAFDSGLGEGASEIVAFDAASRRMFVVNAVEATVDVVSLANPAAPTLVTSIDVTPWGAVANSVDVAGGVVAVAVEAAVKQEPGRVVFFSTGGSHLGDVAVGALPDMVTFTPDGQKVLVANEGEPNDDYTVDPVGSVSIVDLAFGVANAVVTTVGFTDFNVGGPRHGELPDGVRVFGPGASVAQDLEPEYITVAQDGATAWVTLQEANAVAIVDVAQARVSAIVALGYKDHALAANGLDPSDRDGGIHIASWPVRGLYMPDAIASFQLGTTTYLVTANEGDSRDYDGFSEEERIGDLDLDPTAFPNAAALQGDDALGRLKTTNTLGDTDGDGDVDVLYSYGARSFSIWNGATGALVYDSGNGFEQTTATQVPALFNSQGDADSFDSRSDDKGPEPEGVTLGVVDGRTYAFVGLERIGGLMVYDVTNPMAPVFVLYEPASGGDVSPEGLDFVPAASSPSGKALLLVAHEVSGTVAIYQVASDGGTGGGRCTASATKLCLNRGRFEVGASFRTPQGQTGTGRALELTGDTGAFWFFDDDNLEVVVKVLDACVDPFKTYWVFASGLTDVEVTLEVVDTEHDVRTTYTNALGSPFQLVRDTTSFATCP